jgi:hypothetical protein
LAGPRFQREELPLFGYLFPARQAGKRGEGRFSNPCCYDYENVHYDDLFREEMIP